MGKLRHPPPKFQRFSEQVVIYEGLMWTRAKLRKWARCHYTGKPIYPNQLAYRPLTNNDRRMQRITADVFDTAQAVN